MQTDLSSTKKCDCRWPIFPWKRMFLCVDFDDVIVIAKYPVLNSGVKHFSQCFLGS